MSQRNDLRVIPNDGGHRGTTLLNHAAHPLMADMPQQLLTNAFLFRRDLFSKLLDPRRNIDAECGYPDLITPQMYRGVYDRMGLGTRVVSVYPEEAWAVDPEVYDDDDPGTETDFEAEFGKLLKKKNLWHWCHRIDELSGIGHFGVLLLGVNAGDDLSTPLRNGDGDIDNEPLIPPGRFQLLFLRAFDHSQVRVTKLETNTQSARYGQPVEYDITFVDTLGNSGYSSGSAMETITNRKVHWSRAIHVADNRKSNEIYGMPRMQCVFNHIMDWKKMLGGSAEMFWKGGFPGYSFESTPNLNDLGADVTLDAATIKAQMDMYQNGLQRYFALLGVQVKSLAPQYVPPSAHLEEQYKAISIAIGIPMRILLGSERGELASSQDAQAWNKRLNRRQDKYISPYVIRPLVERLVWLGILPPPTDNDFEVHWPDVATPSDTERAAILNQKTQAMATYVSGGVNTLVPELEYMTEFMGMDLEEAESILQAAQEKQDEMAQQQDEQHQQAMQMAQQQGMVPTSTEPLGPGGIKYGQKPEPKLPPAGARGNVLKKKPAAKKKKPTGNEGKQRRPFVGNAWDESKHPRGQPSNAGEFVKKEMKTKGYKYAAFRMKLKDYMARETKMELERIQKEYNTQYEDANSQMQHAIHGTLDSKVKQNLEDRGYSNASTYYKEHIEDLTASFHRRRARLLEGIAWNFEGEVHARHAKLVQRAVEKGIEVPDEVLEQYVNTPWMPKPLQKKVKQYWECQLADRGAKAMMPWAAQAEADYKKARPGLNKIWRKVQEMAEAAAGRQLELDDAISMWTKKGVRAFDKMNEYREKLGGAEAIKALPGGLGMALDKEAPRHQGKLRFLAAQSAFRKAGQMHEDLATAKNAIDKKLNQDIWKVVGVPNTPKTEITWEGNTELGSPTIQNFFSHVLEASVHGQQMKVNLISLDEKSVYGPDRAYYNRTDGVHVKLNGSLSTLAHEVGHHIETAGGFLAMGTGFLLSNSKGAKAKHVGEGYEDHEVYLPSKALFSNYSAKWYSGTATELVSVGVEQLYADAARFATKSPEHFKYVVGILRGDIKKSPDHYQVLS